MERAFYELVARTHDRYEYVVVASTLAPELRGLVEWRRVPSPRHPFPLKAVAFFVLAGLRLVTVRADVVHTMGGLVPNRADLASVHFCHAAFAACDSSRALKHESLSRRANARLSRKIGLAFERLAYRPGRIRVLAAVSAGVERELERHYAEIRATLTPNGVEAGEYTGDEQERLAVRGDNGVNDQLVVLFVGGDWDHKGLGPAIGGIGEAVRRGADARLWVVGRGDVRRYRSIARREGVAPRVTFHGAQTPADIGRFYRGADVFVLPSLYETFSLVAHEAAAARLPVISTKVSGVEELVGSDQAGILVERDAAAIGAAIARLAADPAERKRLGANARRRIEGLTWERSVESVMCLYGELFGSVDRNPVCA
jgi:glycosyltransferase involved in cell wall biosynthesis